MFTPNKKLGQNFLKNTKLIGKMVNSLEVEKGEEIIEIGPGLGAVTKILLETHGHGDIDIKAIEIDIRFVDKLKNMFSEYKNHFEVIEANVLDFLPQYSTEKSFKIIGSLPYYITSPILHEIIKMNKRPKKVVVLIQKEVAKKIAAKAPDSSYLSTFIQTFYEVEYVATVDKNEFSPVPKVDGGILKMTLKPDVNIDVKKYEGFLHKGFSNPRKMLNKVFYEDEINRAQIDSTKRPQNYNSEEWLKFFKILV